MLAKAVLLLACLVALYVLVFGVRRPPSTWPATRRGTLLLLAATAIVWLLGLLGAVLWVSMHEHSLDPLLTMTLILLGVAGGAGLLLGLRTLR